MQTWYLHFCSLPLCRFYSGSPFQHRIAGYLSLRFNEHEDPSQHAAEGAERRWLRQTLP
jgi:hypothetical protein